MTFHAFLWNYLLIFPRVLLVVVFVLLFRRKLYRQFPIFFAYIVSEILQAAVIVPMLLVGSTNSRSYLITYCIALVLSTALRFGVIHEIFAHMFRNYGTLSRFGKPLFRWVTVGLLLAGLFLAVYAGGHDPPGQLLTVRLLDGTASILQCGLLISLFLFSSYLGLSWRSYLFGIAFGVGAVASVDLAIMAIRSQTGDGYRVFLNYVTLALYHCVVLLWICYLWRPERISQYNLQKLPENDLETWNQELQRLL